MSHYIRKKSLKSKITVITSLMLVAVFLIGYFLFNYAFQVYNRTIYESKVGEIQASIRQIEYEMKVVEALSEEFMTQEDLQSSLEKWSGADNNYDKITSHNEILEWLSRLKLRKDYIKGVMLSDNKGNHLTWNMEKVEIDNVYKELIKVNIPDNGSNFWIEPTESIEFFTSARTVRKVKDRSFTPIGRLYIVVDIEKIAEEACQSGLWQMESLFIYGNEKIFSIESFPKEELIKDFLGERERYKLQNVGNKKHFFVKYISDTTNYRYVAVMDFNAIFSNIIRFNIVMVIFFVLLLVLMQILITYFSRKMFKRVDVLCENMRRMEQGDLHIKMEENILEDSLDEIDIMTRQFHKMADKLDFLINDKYKKEILEKETQLELLYSQINPHFLYNTLETINWMALSKGQKEIASLVKALGNLLRSSIGKNQFLLTVKEELNLLSDYVSIQKKRFGDSLEVHLSIDEDVYSYLILKLSTQILVENSIKHVLEKNGGTCRINVSIKEKNGELFITVSDNGEGIPTEKIDVIKKGVHKPGKGIGLENIEKRINLIFGASYGVDICRGENGGAEVTIRIPAQKKEENF